MTDAMTTTHEELPLTDTLEIASKTYKVVNIESYAQLGETVIIEGVRGASYLIMQIMNEAGKSEGLTHTMRASGLGFPKAHTWRDAALTFDGSVLTVHNMRDFSVKAFRIA